MSSTSSLSDSVDSDSDLEEFLNDIQTNGLRDEIQGYMFEPTRNINQHESTASSGSSDSLAENSRLQTSEWCNCDNCQIMDREVECICCHEIKEIIHKNKQVQEKEHVQFDCITDNPGFKVVCLNEYVLETSLYQYQQQYGPIDNVTEHKRKRHIAYRQLVRWCWGVLGKEIRVVLPSCAVMCIRAHFPPHGLEEEFEFTGFKYADE